MTEEKRKVPALRFPGFEGEWEDTKLGEISKKPQYGLNTSATDYDGVNGYIRITDIDESTHTFIRENITSPSSFSSEYLLKENDLLFTRTGASVGKSYCYKEADGKLYFAGFLIRFVVDKANPKFIFYYTLLPSYDKWVLATSMRSGQPGINAEEYSSLKLNLPSVHEQEKIAAFLSEIDERIGLLKKKKERLEEYKRGVMQQIFSRRLRFRDSGGNDYPEWSKLKLGNILIEITDRNNASKRYKVISSTSKGLFYQEEYFNNVIASNDLSSYKVLKHGQLVFSPQNLWLGNININLKYEAGIVSPSYKIFDFNKKYTTPFFCKYFLVTPRMVYEYGLSSEQGASIVRRNLNMDLFSTIDIYLPSLEEQQKIADFLSAIDNKIELCEKQIADTQEFKKGLLQQMFV